LFVIALVQGDQIYSIHDKIYFNETQAKLALNKMISNKKLTENYQVHEVSMIHFK
jgi:hypothetical protein